MEAVSFDGLKSCRIVPNTADGTFCFFPLFYEPVNDMELTIRVSAKGDSTENKTISRNGTAVTVHAPGRRFWSPEDPFLYDIEYILRAPDGTACDYVRSYAGLREISLRNGCILLNGKARYLRFVLDQGYYPDGIMTAPSDEMLKQDILLAMPSRFKCSENCKGLCSGCGVNLNTEKCRCSAKKKKQKQPLPNDTWSALDDLKL